MFPGLLQAQLLTRRPPGWKMCSLLCGSFTLPLPLPHQAPYPCLPPPIPQMPTIMISKNWDLDM